MSEFRMPFRPQNSNKGTFGKVLNFAGSKNYIGAAYLSSLGILKSGAGYVALSSDKEIIKSVSILLPEAVYLSRYDGLKNIDKYTVCLIGCGIGKSFSAKSLVKKVIEKVNIPIVIDADGLNILSTLHGTKLPQNTIITPHLMEASRLLGISVDEIAKDTQGAARELVEKYNCTVVLKSHRTVVCDKDNLYINQHGNSALSKAGTGDVLAGIISGLTAQKMNLFESAKLGVYLHSIAGELASKELSEYSVLATDILKYLSTAIKEIEIERS